MSVKKEYDLDTTHSTLNSFDTLNDTVEPSVSIDIKLEFPYQSVQFQFPPEAHTEEPDDDDDEQQHYLANDPLEFAENTVQSISQLDVVTKTTKLFNCWQPTTTSKKLKKVSTAICTKCNLGFPSPFLFEQHMIDIHQDDRPYPCSHCGKPFATAPQQKTHETIHDPKRFQGEPQFKCDLCDKSYHLKRSLAGHKLKIHTDYKPPKRPSTAPVKEHHSTSGVKNPNAYRKPKEVHSCPYCDLTFNMKCLLQKHLIVHTKERPFSCPICQESFPRKTTLTNHIKNIHQSGTTLKGRSRIRPKCQAKQPCPCTICGKVFQVPSQLTKHIRIHTGEKPFSCEICHRKFRTSCDLSYHMKQNHLKDKLVQNPLKLFKCRVCGKNDFLFFRDYRQHRYGVHKNIPYESEKEKAFACGICGKPYFLREGALICGLLGHDPEQLRKNMFKIKCPECPDEEVFRLHSVLALGRHWNIYHGDKILPARFRFGMNGDKELKDELPSCRIDRKKRDHIKMNGPDPEQIKNENLLYVELDLLEVPEEERFFKWKKKTAGENVENICKICGLKLSTSYVLKRHVQFVHNPNREEQSWKFVCTICGLKLSCGSNLTRHVKNAHNSKNRSKRSKQNEFKSCGKKFSSVGLLRKHSIMVHLSKVGKRKVGRPEKNLMNVLASIKTEGATEREFNCYDSLSVNGISSVNIRDQGAVKAILNFQTLKVAIKRIIL